MPQSPSRRRWNWRLLRAGTFRLDGGAMFGIIPKALWSDLNKPDRENRITLQTNCLLLEDGGERVLVETGYGNKFDQKERSIFAMEKRWIRDALEEVGVAPADINHVILTHLHFDHAGGLSFVDGKDDDPKSTFPNAKIHVQKVEWEDAIANKSTMRRTYMRNHLDPVEDQVQLVEGEVEVTPGIRVRPVPGHTWGQQAVIFRDAEGTVCFPGDVMPTINHVGLPYNMAYDMMPYENMQTKQTLLADAQRDGWRIVIDHEPGPAVVTVDRDDRGRFKLVQASS
ncbi:MAG: MBL fold metallo-hydrolase [Phycisphaerales bacterium]